MLARESAGPNFDLPEEVLQLLPSDPFEQLDVARKITSIALSTRVSALESELSVLTSTLTDRENYIAELQSHIESLDASLSDAAEKLARAEEEKESLVKDNAHLSNTVRKLHRDVAKLESFKKTLMRSLNDDEDSSERPSQIVDSPASGQASLPSQSISEENGSSLLPSRASSVNSNSEMGNSNAEDHEMESSRPRVSQSLLLASQTTTPRLTPPGSPPIVSASTSPKRNSVPASPRRHSISFATSRGMFDDRSSLYSSAPSSQHSSISSLDGASQPGRARVDGKEFFRQVRSRLSYEQFAAFLTNVKELNSHKQNKEETLRKADEIFGSDNKDLYIVFEGLITRNVHS